ncbi:hypothetical protein, partial [Okeania sp. SIO2G5]|uniref:hypothetical protein n=1 Tax=Okeania sp. SIO2G5 TaxID=2607796 RepID=UPI00338DAFC7
LKYWGRIPCLHEDGVLPLFVAVTATSVGFGAGLFCHTLLFPQRQLIVQPSPYSSNHYASVNGI